MVLAPIATTAISTTGTPCGVCAVASFPLLVFLKGERCPPLIRRTAGERGKRKDKDGKKKIYNCG